MARKIKLKTDRGLMDPNFEGYKLSLEPLPLYSSKLDGGDTFEVRGPGEDEFSYQHVKLFSQFNALVEDPFSESPVAFGINSRTEAVYAFEVVEDGQPVIRTTVTWSPQATSATANVKEASSYNPSMCFASPDLAVYSDGRGSLYVLKTGLPPCRSVTPWSVLFRHEVCGAGTPFVVEAAVADQDAGVSSVHCVLRYIESKDAVCPGVQGGGSSVVNVVEWVDLTAQQGQGSDSFVVDRVRRYVFYGSADYLRLIRADGGRHLVCVSEKPFKLIYDSVGMDDDEDGDATDATSGGKTVEGPDTVVPPAFYWAQGVDEIRVAVPLPPVSAEGLLGKRDIKVDLKPSELSVKFRDQAADGVCGRLWNVLQSDSLVWTRHPHYIEITASKANEGMIWQRFLKDGPDGVEVMDGREFDEICGGGRHPEGKIASPPDQGSKPEEEPPQQVYNAMELDECDATEEDLAMYVVNRDTAKTEYSCNLSSGQWLGTVPASKGQEAPQFLLRSDVDGLVWSVNYGVGQELEVNHVGTFNAFGYVQASKQLKKFTCASPNLEYVAICDVSRHLYVYRQPLGISKGCQLRNRKTGQVVQKVAKQHVIKLPTEDEDIVGALAGNSFLFVLTKSTIFAINLTP